MTKQTSKPKGNGAPPPEPKKQDGNAPARQAGVEGEGSYSATHRYNEGLKRSMEKGDTEKLAKAAEKALEGPEGEELEAAAEAAKRGQTAKKTKTR